MKKLILSCAVIASSMFAFAQVSVKGVSPAAVVGSYTHTWADPAGGDWSTPDFYTPGTFVEDTLMIVDDGSTGTNPQGNPISAEGCNPLINDLTGKIAVVYRNTCEFGTKALNAEDAGAVGVIIINRDDEAIGMGGGADGLSVTIPVVMVPSSVGSLITSTMATDTVVMFLGNKQNLNANDAGAVEGEAMISKFGSMPLFMANNGYAFDLGIQAYNYGSSDNDVTINATITGPSGEVYNEDVGPVTVVSGDTLAAFNGNPESFPPFAPGTFELGEYELSYTISLGVADDDPSDNVFASNFTITEEGTDDGVISTAHIDDGTGMLTSNTFPMTTDMINLKTCVMLQESYPSPGTGIEGLYFSVYTDTSVNELPNAQIALEVFEWNDAWTQIDPTTGWAGSITFDNLVQVGAGTHYPASNDENGDIVYASLDDPVILTNDQRYLFCVQSYTGEFAFGYDNTLDYSANQSIYLQPVSPINVDDTWYSGWTSATAPAVGAKIVAGLGISEINNVEGIAYPNPANNEVTIEVEAQGDAVLTITDVSGRTIASNEVSLDNGTTNVDISSLETGIYIFNVTFEDGRASQFNVVKK